jgi:hypothetical protein
MPVTEILRGCFDGNIANSASLETSYDITMALSKSNYVDSSKLSYISLKRGMKGGNSFGVIRFLRMVASIDSR